MEQEICRGDVVLVDELGQGLISASIALGERMRYRRKRQYARWTHAAIVYDAPRQDPNVITIVEARAATGVHTAFLSKYDYRRTIGHMRLDDSDWNKVKDFLDQVLSKREKYDFVSYAGLFVYALTGTTLCIQRAGTATCSGLVADALTHAGLVWHRPPFAMTPADLAFDLDRLDYTTSSTDVTVGRPGPGTDVAWLIGGLVG
jgi:hypothetical protein